MHIKTHSLFSFLFFFLLQTLGAALPEGTLILTTHGQIPIEQLKQGDTMITPGANHSFRKEVSIHSIEAYTSSEIIRIITDQGSFSTSASQHFYLANRSCHVAADNIKPRDVLLSLTQKTCKCLEVKKLHQPIVFYDLSLASVHEYFAGELQLVTHNTFNVSPGLIPAAAAWLSTPVIARLSLNQRPTFFTDFSHAKDVVLEQIRSFVHQTKTFKNHTQKTPFSTKALCYLDTPQACRIEGISVQSQFLIGMTENPSLYGPMCYRSFG